jgi:monoterpene epsilon-lactone hydrolase
MKSRGRRWLLVVAGVAAVLIAFGLLRRPAPLDPGAPGIADDGAVRIPAFRLPYSSLASPGAAEYFVWKYRLISESMKKLDWGLSKFYKTLVDKQRARYAVEIRSRKIAGVEAEEFTPAGGIAPENQHRVLINLHGGAFAIGAVIGGQVESIPIAAVAKMKVISLDYRQSPLHRFPSASEDVAAVYRELLKDYKPESIGIYGCSAGGYLTAQSAAWLQKENLPTPGALGLIGGALGTARGDSWYTAAYATDSVPGGGVGYGAPKPDQVLTDLAPMYFLGADPHDPLVAPVESPEVLAKFPPTLLITSTRATDLSSVVYDHTQLVKAGVDADLHVWEGMDHCFLYEPDLPESREAYDVIARFFARHLR